MAEKSTHEFIFHKADRAVTMCERRTVKVKGDSVKVDPLLLFQRLVTIGERMGEIAPLFSYKLCTYPAALFDSNSLPLPAVKSTLCDAIWNNMKEKQCNPPTDVQYILDGGALLHRLPWQRGSSYNALCESYVKYVQYRYGSAHIIFDGYTDKPTTKDAAHVRRTGSEGVAIQCSGDMIMQCKKEDFIRNQKNKQGIN